MPGSSVSDAHGHSELVAKAHLRGQSVRELASGIDALYLSGRAGISAAVLEELERRRDEALEARRPIAVSMGGEEFGVLPKPFGKYRYCLSHPNGLVGVTASEHLPALRVQPRAELLHGIGPAAAVDWFTSRCETAFGPVAWSVSRLDLFCDVQGWQLDGNERDRFECRAQRRDTHEETEELTGFEFGRRTTGTLAARIYDKTLQVATKGIDYWPAIWGPDFDPDCPVLRVEFEIGR
jgi:hypothetical protein